MKYLLDTHAAFWLVIDSPKLGKKARRTLSRAQDGAVALSDMTLFELSLLDRQGKISLEPTLTSFLRDLSTRLVVLPIDAEIAADAVSLPLKQADPFDRVIVATARRHRLTLITKDGHIEDSGSVATLW